METGLKKAVLTNCHSVFYPHGMENIRAGIDSLEVIIQMIETSPGLHDMSLKATE